MASTGRVVRRTFGPSPNYATYVSPYGPKTKHIPNVLGISGGMALRYGWIASGFGVAAGVFALFFFDEVPKVRNDIVTKIPYIGDHYVREVAPEDNPF